MSNYIEILEKVKKHTGIETISMSVLPGKLIVDDTSIPKCLCYVVNVYNTPRIIEGSMMAVGITMKDLEDLNILTEIKPVPEINKYTILRSSGKFMDIEYIDYEKMLKECSLDNLNKDGKPYKEQTMLVTYVDSDNNDIGKPTGYKDINGNMIHTNHIMLWCNESKLCDSSTVIDGLTYIEEIDGKYYVSNNHCSSCDSLTNKRNNSFIIIGVELDEENIYYTNKKDE